MSYCCEVERKKLQNRINRICGQLNALKKRFDDEKFDLEEDPNETIRQLTAVKGALNGMINSFIEHYAKGHLIDKIKSSDKAEAQMQMENLLEIIRVYGK